MLAKASMPSWAVKNAPKGAEGQDKREVRARFAVEFKAHRTKAFSEMTTGDSIMVTLPEYKVAGYLKHWRVINKLTPDGEADPRIVFELTFAFDEATVAALAKASTGEEFELKLMKLQRGLFDKQQDAADDGEDRPEPTGEDQPPASEDPEPAGELEAAEAG